MSALPTADELHAWIRAAVALIDASEPHMDVASHFALPWPLDNALCQLFPGATFGVLETRLSPEAAALGVRLRTAQVIYAQIPGIPADDEPLVFSGVQPPQSHADLLAQVRRNAGEDLATQCSPAFGPEHAHTIERCYHIDELDGHFQDAPWSVPLVQHIGARLQAWRQARSLQQDTVPATARSGAASARRV